MKRPTQNFIVDIAIFIAFILLVTTGILMAFILPPGKGHGMVVWGLSRHAWGDVHFWVAMGLVGLLALHLVLHWTWIVCMVKGKPLQGTSARSRVTFGWVGLIALLALAASPLLTPTETTDEVRGSSEQREAMRDEQERPAGSITLGEIEYVTGVPISHLARELGLPDHVSRNEHLQALQNRHGVEIEEVRRIVRAYETAPSAAAALSVHTDAWPGTDEEQ